MGEFLASLILVWISHFWPQTMKLDDADYFLLFTWTRRILRTMWKHEEYNLRTFIGYLHYVVYASPNVKSDELMGLMKSLGDLFYTTSSNSGKGPLRYMDLPYVDLRKFATMRQVAEAMEIGEDKTWEIPPEFRV